MRLWMVGLGALWVGALALSASVLQLTRTVPRPVHRATITRSVTPRRAASPAVPQAVSKTASASPIAPTQSSTTPEAPNIFSAWESITQQIVAPKQPLTPQDAQAIKTAIKPVSATERVVDRQAVWGTLKDNPFQVMREASLQPAFASGRLVGVQLTAVPESGILRQSGFQSGDVIRSINGQAITNPALLVTLPRMLPQAGVIEVQLERKGQPVTLTFRAQ